MTRSNYNLIVTHGQNHGLSQAIYDHYVKKGDHVAIIQLPYREDMRPPLFSSNFSSSQLRFSPPCLNGSFVALRMTGQFISVVALLVWVRVLFGSPKKLFISNPLNFFGVFCSTLRAPETFYLTIDFSLRAFGALNFIYAVLDKFACRRCDLVLGVSKTMNLARSRIYKISSQKFSVLAVGVNSIKKPKKNAGMRADQNDGLLKVVYVGSVEKKYCLAVLFEALSTLPTNRWKMDVIGDGKELKILRDLSKNLSISKDITFHGNLTNRNSLISIVNSCHIGVCLIDPSLDDFSRFADITKIKEYIAYGCPVICSENLANRYPVDFPIIPTKLTQNSIASTINELFLRDEVGWRDLYSSVTNTQKSLTWKHILDACPHI